MANLLEAYQLLEQIKRKARKEPNLLAVTYVSMCKVLEGYIPLGEFLDMEVTAVGEILDSAIYLNREMEKDNAKMKASQTPSRRGRR